MVGYLFLIWTDGIPFLLQDGVDFLSKWLAQYAEQEEASSKTEAGVISSSLILETQPVQFVEGNKGSWDLCTLISLVSWVDFSTQHPEVHLT